ncbi:MAG TPA: heme ABC transporter ATP-binding protein [Anaerolineales bacterium]|nr:heme ABC transporter ATP-binding protein [Anaerolineales bacterium]
MLKIDSLSVKYGEKRVLNNISLEARSGEIIALIGANGAGKTTLIRAVSGTVPIEAGEIYVDGENLSHLSTPERARTLAVVPQTRQMGGAYSVEQVVMMGRTAYMSWLGRESQADQDVVDVALTQTQLEEFRNRSIAQLSGGERQRVLLARALAQFTPVLLLDEPTNHLDLKHQTNLLSLIKKLTQEKELAVLMAVHDLNLVSFFADKVALLLSGELKEFGTPQEVLTSETISEAYQTSVEIIPHPETGAPIIFPQGAVSEEN